MIDIRSIYASIANQAITRACEAHSLHGEFDSIGHGMSKLEEEFNECIDECRKIIHTPNISSDMEKYELYERIFQESLDVAVVAVRLAHLAQSNLSAPKNATETIVEANNHE